MQDLNPTIYSTCNIPHVLSRDDLISYPISMCERHLRTGSKKFPATSFSEIMQLVNLFGRYGRNEKNNFIFEDGVLCQSVAESEAKILFYEILDYVLWSNSDKLNESILCKSIPIDFIVADLDTNVVQSNGDSKLIQEVAETVDSAITECTIPMLNHKRKYYMTNTMTSVFLQTLYKMYSDEFVNLVNLSTSPYRLAARNKIKIWITKNFLFDDIGDKLLAIYNTAIEEYELCKVRNIGGDQIRDKLNKRILDLNSKIKLIILSQEVSMKKRRNISIEKKFSTNE